MKFSVSRTMSARPEQCFESVRESIRQQDPRLVASVIRGLRPKVLADTIAWTSYNGPTLKGKLTRAWGKGLAGLHVEFSQSGNQVVTTLSEPGWLSTGRWPVYFVSAIIPPLWALFALNLVLHLSLKFGMPRTARRISEQFPDPG